MDIEKIKINFTGRLHCPECNCMYIIIDNEIQSCPGCEFSSRVKNLQIYGEDAGEEEIVQYQT